MINKDFWRGKKVFLTGHTGFKGSWLTVWLKELGADVCGYSLPVSDENKLWQKLNLGKSLRSEHGNILDLPHLEKTIVNFQPDIVIHMAAQALVSTGYADPLLTMNTNIIGTANLLSTLNKLNHLKVCLNVTTDKVYNNSSLEAHKETNPLGGNDPYSSSKACSELITHAWRVSYLQGLNAPILATARSGNVIGGGDWSKNRLIPDLIRAHEKGEKLKVRNLKGIRPWQHVLDVLSGYLLYIEFLAGHQSAPMSLNFAPHEKHKATVQDILELSKKHFPHLLKDYEQGATSFKEEEELVLNAELAQKTLGWHCSWNAEQSVMKTLAWYQNLFQGDDALTITKKQIGEYN